MNDPQLDSPFECSHCGATGRIPLVRGERACPQCGEHLWTVRSTSPPKDFRHLGPDYRVPIRKTRPPLSRKGLRRAKLCVFLFRPIVCVCIIFRQRVFERRAHKKLQQISIFSKREELEQVLGKPVYAVDGKEIEAEQRPDLVECYESEGCCIDLWFKDDRLVEFSGFVKPTVWDMALSGNPAPAQQDRT